MFSIFTPAFTFKNRGASPSESITSYVTGSDKLLVPGKVIASNNIAQGSMTLPIEPAKLFGKPDIVQVSVAMSGFGTLMLDSKSEAIWSEDVHWVRAIRLSDDCHNYNIQLKLKPSQRISNNLPNKNISAPQLILQVVRPIVAGQELLLWFSEDILAMLQIAFLTPANIQGQKEYVCLRCGAMYESPNPLKLHITLNCGIHPVTKLWDKLGSILTNSSTSEILEGEIFDFKLVPDTSLTRQKIAMDLTTSTSRRDCLNSITHRPFLENSAFKPFKRNENHIRGAEIGVEGTVNWPLNVANLTSSGNIKEDEAQIESLVSSLGKTKQGHMCVYCGKCYSRKYGLKIHIRTHTGYKPLECKFCKRPFGDPSNLNKHVRLHAEGNTPYRCDLCGKVLVRRRDLERHLKSRHMPETHPDMNIIVSRNSEEDVDDVEKMASPKDDA
ncbi:zinc finger protein 426 [Coccinella septempunctata]|uniref:zinc finger protein 426 n=1 Tax=Coccinella septempunctata TaxID=41139 RepID=UPI001D094A17|nr:zinc finger protein 426 [Coccinella septempunctata]